MTLRKSNINEVTPPQVGNVLAVFVDVNDGQVKLKDQYGNATTLSSYIGGGGGGGVIIEGTGAGSSIRCGVGNITLGACSAAIGGCANSTDASACLSTISGGLLNQITASNSWIGYAAIFDSSTNVTYTGRAYQASTQSIDFMALTHHLGITHRQLQLA